MCHVAHLLSGLLAGLLCHVAHRLEWCKQLAGGTLCQRARVPRAIMGYIVEKDDTRRDTRREPPVPAPSGGLPVLIGDEWPCGD